jgi:hypothetical protein
MEHLLQKVAGSEMMSMLDGFSGYNQISVAEEDQHKTAFITPWGTFAYNRMPFGLINAGSTFQRAMNSSFGDLRDKIIVIYLDDLTVFSKKRGDHLKDLSLVLQRCRMHGISLNPKKSVFFVEEGKLLGHIVSKEGIRIDPDRIKAIRQLSLPVNRDGVRSFFGQVNFLRAFVPDFAELTRELIKMMSEREAFKWNNDGKRAFEEIKESIALVPTLTRPDFKRDFIIYYYASEHTLSGILT